MQKKIMSVLLTVLLICTLLVGCGSTNKNVADNANSSQKNSEGSSNSNENSKKGDETQEDTKELSGKLTIYHAGSLSVPFKEMEKEFEKIHPDVDVQLTAGGSRSISRKVTELGDKVDILASADYTVIDSLVMPEYADWNAYFAKNSMVIMYTDKSKYADEINSDNWFNILLKDDVNYGHSDPDADPCGYRTLLVWQLARKHYDIKGLNRQLKEHCPEKNIRPKSVELISLLETGGLDYAFEYESVARQHVLKNSEFKYVKLPDEINLSSIEQEDFYKNASVELKGKEPGETITKEGQSIVYSLTMPKYGENKEIAEEFLKFFFDKNKGLKILEDNGQPTLDKITVKGENIPEFLK